MPRRRSRNGVPEVLRTELTASPNKVSQKASFFHMGAKWITLQQILRDSHSTHLATTAEPSSPCVSYCTIAPPWALALRQPYTMRPLAVPIDNSQLDSLPNKEKYTETLNQVYHTVDRSKPDDFLWGTEWYAVFYTILGIL